MGTLKIQDFPKEERPRERLRDKGASALTTAELISILLRTGRQGASAVEMGQEMVHHFGSLEALSRASVGVLSQFKGVGESKAAQLLAAFELGTRLQQSISHRRRIDCSQDVWDALGYEMRQRDQEIVMVMVLNTRRELLATEEVSRGILNESLIHPREIFKPALFHHGYGIILVHNHPSGDPTPSRADHEMTQQIQSAGKIMDLPLLDHVILGNPEKTRDLPYFSFLDAGLI